MANNGSNFFIRPGMECDPPSGIGKNQGKPPTKKDRPIGSFGGQKDSVDTKIQSEKAKTEKEKQDEIILWGEKVRNTKNFHELEKLLYEAQNPNRFNGDL